MVGGSMSEDGGEVPIMFECGVCNKVKEPEAFKTDKDGRLLQSPNGKFICEDCSDDYFGEEEKVDD